LHVTSLKTVFVDQDTSQSGSFTWSQITNLIGNGVATLVISRSENAFDEDRRASAVAAMSA
jgi:hypothetical protein